MSKLEKMSKEIATQDVTLIKSVEIVNLFEIFNYHVEYPKSENVLIITGPNGFGKTQILNIIFNLFNRRFSFFQTLVFDKITVNLTQNRRIVIEKKRTDNQALLDLEFHEQETNPNQRQESELLFLFYDREGETESLSYPKFSQNAIKRIRRLFPSIRRYTKEKWIDTESSKLYSSDDLLAKFGDFLLGTTPNETVIKDDLTNENHGSLEVHQIKEQRLFKKETKSQGNPIAFLKYDQTIMVESIQTYAEELKGLISEQSRKSFTRSQALDSSYPDRLISEKNKVSREEYDVRFANLTDKQERLTKNGLYETERKVLSYSEDDAKALLVYLNDLEQKLSVFDDLLEKLELFTGILNNRRFTFKSIAIDRDKGFYFKTSTGKVLPLTQLSSGEQHEVVLLYELIFKTKPGILVLIDEPEISLHVTWQKEFLDDLLRIIEKQKFQVLIATHSPSIINDRWDLVYNLAQP